MITLWPIGRIGRQLCPPRDEPRLDIEPGLSFISSRQRQESEGLVKKTESKTKSKTMIPVTVEAKEFARIDEITEFQGQLKTLSPKNFSLLKNSMLRHGFARPVFIWLNEGKKMLLDGHQALFVLKTLLQDGYGIEGDRIPVVYIRAKHEKDAKEKILLYASQYGKITTKTFADFILESQLDFEKIREIVEVPSISLAGIDNLLQGAEEVPGVFPEELMIAQAMKDYVPPQNVDEIIRGIITPTMAMAQFNRLAQGKKDGYYISALFNPHRLTTKCTVRYNVIESLQREGTRLSWCKWIVTQGLGDVHPNNYLRYVMIGIGNLQVAKEFYPWISYNLTKRFCKDGSRILDPCAGWGGRLIGVLATGLKVHYVGVDPAGKTVEGLGNLYAFLKQSIALGTAEFHRKAFEDMRFKANSFDLAVTSPPYFDTEHYSEDPEQSILRYQDYNLWVEKFLTPLVIGTMAALKPGCPFILNVGVTKYDLLSEVKQICMKNKLKLSVMQDFMVGGTGIAVRSDSDETSGEQFLKIWKE